MTELIDIMLQDKAERRTEIAELKGCQVAYLKLSAVSLPAVLAAVFALTEQIQAQHALVLYTPLFVIIPCFTVFFDKAKSITRLVGYLRILEGMILAEIGRIPRKLSHFNGWNDHFLGWEVSLPQLRNREQEIQKEKPYRYWISTRIGRVVGDGFVCLFRPEPYYSGNRYWFFNAIFFLEWQYHRGLLPPSSIGSA